MKLILSFLCAAILFGCTSNKIATLAVQNVSSEPRENEMVEINVDPQWTTAPFILTDSTGKEIPYQLTYNNKLIFQASVPARSEMRYQLKAGVPQKVDTIVTGNQYPERVDDIAWENDRIAFRTYGPALQASGEKAYGYDVWAKRVSHPVVAERYRLELKEGITYHKDNGNGCDFYKVGPTLGAGTAALMVADTLVYPYCYDTFEILDNGPLRFTVKLTYHPLKINTDTAVVETRLLSLDAGSQLNKATVSYEGLSTATPLAVGIVLHDTTTNLQADADLGYIAYADPVDREYGQLYLAAILPGGEVKSAQPVYFSAQEQKTRGANGHLLACTTYQPESSFTYYWGAGWSKWGFATQDEWFNFVRKESAKKAEPMMVIVVE